MKEIKFLPVSWEELNDICFKMAKKILEQNLRFDRIACISRGGLVISRLFSDFLSLPISTFTIVSYIRIGKPAQPKVVEPIKVNIKNERILLIDEIVDRGTTLKKAIDYLFSFSPKEIVSLVPYVKSYSIPLPDFWEIKSDNWVIFPYETKETIKDLIPLWKKENLTQEEIRNRFIKLGLKKNEVDYFSNFPLL